MISTANTYVLTQQNYESSSGDYVLKFNEQKFENSEICLVSSAVYKQWFNISASLGNNIIQVTTTDTNSVQTTTTITFPDGYYSLKDINAYLASVMASNINLTVLNGGVYLQAFTISTTQNELLSIMVNSTQIGSNYVYPVVVFCPGLQTLLGVSQTYGAGSSTTNKTKTALGTKAPQYEYIPSLIFTCNMVYSPLANNPRGIINSIFLSDTEFGALASSDNVEQIWMKISNANYTECRISTYSSSTLQKLSFIDTNSVFQIAIRKSQ